MAAAAAWTRTETASVCVIASLAEADDIQGGLLFLSLLIFHRGTRENKITYLIAEDLYLTVAAVEDCRIPGVLECVDLYVQRQALRKPQKTERRDGIRINITMPPNHSNCPTGQLKELLLLLWLLLLLCCCNLPQRAAISRCHLGFGGRGWSWSRLGRGRSDVKLPTSVVPRNGE